MSTADQLAGVWDPIVLSREAAVGVRETAGDASLSLANAWSVIL